MSKYISMSVPSTRLILLIALAVAGPLTFYLTRVAGAGDGGDAPVGTATGATDDGRLIVYGADGLTPVYIEDPVDARGVPIPVGPQHPRYPMGDAERFPALLSSQPEPAGPPRVATLEETARGLWGPEYEWRVENGLPLLPEWLELPERPDTGRP